MKHAWIALLLVALVPVHASALDTGDVLALAAMPLAVAAASEVSGVPVGELSHFVATLNRAQVPPVQVVQVVRYAPAALVVREEPRFVEYVDDQFDRGITGTRLVTVIEERYRSYDLEPQFVMFDEPAPAYVIRDDYIPPPVVTRVAQYAPSYTPYAPAYAVRDTDDILALAAMPLAVAAVSNITGVPVRDLSQFVSTLNRAQVPPTQFVQVVRYAPAALVVRDSGPTFVEYVDARYHDGYYGPRLVNVIEDRYRTYYDLAPQYVRYAGPATTYVVRNDYVPSVVVARMARYAPAYYGSDNLLGLVAMPLAVAAVADMAGVPVHDLTMLVSSLNAARMPPMQVVEVLRYAPAPLLLDSAWYGSPRFAPYVRTQVVSGVRGPVLFDTIGQQLYAYDLEPRYEPIRSPEVVFVRDEYFPPVVRTRIADVRAHPHGGPPGQLKKELGFQTGAEVVHGARPGWEMSDSRVVRTARAERQVSRWPDVERRLQVEQRRVVGDSGRASSAVAQRDRSERRPAVVRETQRRGETKRVDRPRAERERPQRIERSRASERPSVRRSRQAERPQQIERSRASERPSVRGSRSAERPQRVERPRENTRPQRAERQRETARPQRVERQRETAPSQRVDRPRGGSRPAAPGKNSGDEAKARGKEKGKGNSR